ncbi:Rne/Rng family ribonuclease [Tissierella pigra]|uniref:Rne/Rng family ribonuclease n=1 Tax=Tissierella pigra TaxID=2607614 RepID=A0A6N7XPZ5_9FIRM|nr:Rne/Rng family ribonuclease [Tissierella pigra]MSU02872.1 Rne/Rng family ribonuclease [Tissierella pigra]
MSYIFIDSLDGFQRVGIVENNRLVEYHLEKEEKKIVGNIYRGRVVNVLQGMEAAFVDIGEGKNAYLYVKDALPKEMLYSGKRYSISEVVKSGQEIIVQVIKEPSGNKGAKVTTHIEIPGRFLVFTPFSNKINISKKIRSIVEVESLKEIGKKIIKNDTGLIFRTASEGIDESILQEEYNILYDIYAKIEKERNFLPCPKLLYKEPSLGYQIIRDSFNDETEKIIVNNKEVYDNLILTEETLPFRFSNKMKLDKDFSINYNTGIQLDLQTALQRIVSLKSGGYIVIDETEALTAIDVNTGKFVGSSSLEDTIVKTNIEAAGEIARQIRLRDIGGIIIIDFIDMKNKNDISNVLAILRKNLKKDKIKTNIIDITKLGLVELTRKKIRRSLSRDFYKVCPKCEGRGHIIE